jgi:hypothetical protein
MRRLLPVLTLGLLLLVLADRLSHAISRHQLASSGASGRAAPDSVTARLRPSRANAQGGVAAPALEVPPPDTSGPTPVIDRMARLAARQQLNREAGVTYLDSLIISTDSVVRRWPDRYGTPLRVSLLEGGVPGYAPRMAEFVRQALDRWEATGIGIRFQVVGDTSGADIVVRWIDHFDFDRAGQTDLTWDQSGRVHRALISLALRTNTGATLPDGALFSVAVHEAGHALGLPHSADSSDVMFPATRTGTLSERDRRTVAVLYRLPPGPVRDVLKGQ